MRADPTYDQISQALLNVRSPTESFGSLLIIKSQTLIHILPREEIWQVTRGDQVVQMGDIGQYACGSALDAAQLSSVPLLPAP
jgi:hypothetical protein